MNYRIFVRDWWRIDPSTKQRVPNTGDRGETIGEAETEEEARAICREWNDNTEPGYLSRKAEFESQ
jgi:hypothetical protein